MTRYLSEFTRHAQLAIGGYAVAVLVVFTLMIVAASGNRLLQDEIATKSEILETIKRRTVPDLRAKPHRANPAALISATSETIAASTLQKYVLDRLEAAGGTVLSVQAELSRESTGERARRLTAQLAFEGGIEQLQKFLFDLETGVPFIFIDSLAVQPAGSAPSATRAGDRLRVTLIASSYWQNPSDPR